MNRIRISTIYASSLSGLALYFAAWNILAFLSVPYFRALSLITVTGLIPILYYREKISDILWGLLFTGLFLGLAVSTSNTTAVSGNFMNAFILILVAALIMVSVKDSFLLLYSGLSFYIVGVFILLTFSVIELTIMLAGIADYYISCIGMTCPGITLNLTPGMILLILSIPATYPYFHRAEFRRDIHDKEGS